MVPTKAKIVESVHRDLDLPKSKLAQAIESVLEIIKQTLANEVGHLSP